MHPSRAPSSHPHSAAWLPCPTSAVSTTATSDERRRPGRSLFPPAAKSKAQYPLATVLPPAVLSTPAHGQLPAPTTRRSWAGSITGTIAVDSSAAIEFWPTTADLSDDVADRRQDRHRACNALQVLPRRRDDPDRLARTSRRRPAR